jgi:alpha-beta hydrolase superfamily lysophospholipase
MDHARKQTRELKLPVLALQAADDRHLSPRGLKFLRRRAGHKDSDFRLLADGSHAIMRGAAKAEVFEAVAGFVERNSRGVKAAEPVSVAPAAEPISDPS